MAGLTLYENDWVPSPRRVRMYLAEKGIKVDRVHIDLRANEHTSPNYLRINPRGTLPTLRLADGSIITESIAICRYFEILHRDPPLFGDNQPREAGFVEEWTRRIEQEGYAAASYALRNSASVFHERALPNVTVPTPQIPALVERAQLMWGGFVETLEEQLTHYPWIAGKRFTFADIMGLTTLDFAKAARLPAPPGQATKEWYARVKARPALAGL